MMKTKRHLWAFSAITLGVVRSTHAIGVVNLGYIGANSQSGLIFDSAGNLYGTTESGGTNSEGSAFELSGVSHQTVTTLISFPAGGGYSPISSLVADTAGNFYGATIDGGVGHNGVVYELSGTNHQTVTNLVTFNGSNGSMPLGGLIADSSGNLYGSTSGNGYSGHATVFELSGSDHHTFTTLATFSSPFGEDGPNGNLLLDGAGNLYGCTEVDGDNGDGAVFELTGPDHKSLKTLVSFNGLNGSLPTGYLTEDAAGNLYGTTYIGGGSNDGTVFELSGPDHQTLTTLVNFNSSSGINPNSGVVFDAAGSLYGTTISGGFDGYGSVFKLSADHQTLTTPVRFNSTIYGPDCYLIPDATGSLYGTAMSGYGFRVEGIGFVVPEPSGMSLIALSGVALIRRQKRKV